MNSSEINEISTTEMAKVLRKCKNRKSTGADNIPVRTIKRLNQTQRCTFKQVMNNVWCTGVLPKKWKIAKVILLQKPEMCADRILTNMPSQRNQ